MRSLIIYNPEQIWLEWLNREPWGGLNMYQVQVTQKSLCTYTTNNKSASFLALIFVNWHSGGASRMATHVDCWRSICTCIPTREHQRMNWKKRRTSSMLRMASQLLPMERIFWSAHFFFDKAWFHMSGYANSRKNRFWSATNPHEM
jgi:hypothetical protein